MPVFSHSFPVADLAGHTRLIQSAGDVFLAEQDRCLLPDGPVLPTDTAISGWHHLLSMTYAVEDWFWDAVIIAWREWPLAFTAETARALGCEGYTYLTAIAPPF